MSHFFVTVILPKGTKKTNVESTVANEMDSKKRRFCIAREFKIAEEQ
jgi:hypothetical protein